MQKIRPDMDIGKNIQSLRYKNNLTQDQVIAKVSELVALAKIFHTDINAFFDGLL